MISAPYLVLDLAAASFSIGALGYLFGVHPAVIVVCALMYAWFMITDFCERR